MHNIKYLQIMLDDFNRNRLNSNIINVFDTPGRIKVENNIDHNISIDNQCDVSNSETLNLNRFINKRLTQNQIYAINEIKNNQNQSTVTKVKNHNASDLFAMIPTKHNELNIGDICVENGQNLQVNKREYFGPISLSRINVKLLDDKGNVINLNGNDWAFTILCETLYQSNKK